MLRSGPAEGTDTRTTRAARRPRRPARTQVRAVKTAPEPKVIGKRYATVAEHPGRADAKAKVVTVVAAGTKLTVTDTIRKGFRLVAYRDKDRWVTDKFLSAKNRRPAPRTRGGVSTRGLRVGSKVESGLTKDAVRVHRALCARYPQVTSFGGRRSNDFHGSGQAVDAMISNSTVGWQMARWVRANAKRLGVSEIIYSQKIWTVQRGSEGWRSMSDRGSATANHYDHVHVSVYGNSGTG